MFARALPSAGDASAACAGFGAVADACSRLRALDTRDASAAAILLGEFGLGAPSLISAGPEALSRFVLAALPSGAGDGVFAAVGVRGFAGLMVAVAPRYAQ